ncbi:hypothetical protein LX36DRAFT_735285, partial [Colletotrichum falcatum]
QTPKAVTYDHTHRRTRDPVRSPIDKPVRAGLVVGSVTTSEYLVLYVLVLLFVSRRVTLLRVWERGKEDPYPYIHTHTHREGANKDGRGTKDGGTS